ncbi:hypothetical protein Tco_0978768 [Tanacetum coccineum]|uniref:Uncharacterized protein n=1 Tax=Tanacetum coccineum TaxID=301880 RepID=A0ABQ5ENS5_9ASTR
MAGSGGSVSRIWKAGSGGSVYSNRTTLQPEPKPATLHTKVFTSKLWRVFNPKGLIKKGKDCLIEGVMFQRVSVKLAKFLVYLVSSHGWLGSSTQPTPREVDRWESWFKVYGDVEKVRALGANGVMSGSKVRVVWMEVGGGVVSAIVVSRVVLGFLLVILRVWEAFVR